MSLKDITEAPPPRLFLIIMANTHDNIISKACEKDAKAIKSVFSEICQLKNFDFFCIEISGNSYKYDNVKKAIKALTSVHENDVAIFYYTGHGFSYKSDSRKFYPQLDMRSHSKQVEYNKINFINKHTRNLSVVLQKLLFTGIRINIAIGDCCNTTVPYKRPYNSEIDVLVAEGIVGQKTKKLNKYHYNDENNYISILVAASQHGQPALTDPEIGSIFTHHFSKALKSVVSGLSKKQQYIPWIKVLKKSARQAFKLSKEYDAGEGKPGKQKAVFDVFVEREENLDETNK